MSSPEKKKNKKKELLPTPTKNPSLPDDLLVSCLARVSRLYYPTLSLVSKRFQSLLASPELYNARSLLGHTENFLYVCLGIYPCFLWYTLRRKPDQTLTSDTSQVEKSSGYILTPVPVPHSTRVKFSGLVAVGSNIYNIEEHSSSVSILDCMSHTWREAPSLRVKLSSLSASVVDQKIYVAGMREKDEGSFKNSFEVLDKKTHIRDPEPIPCSETKCRFFCPKTASIDGKFHVINGREVDQVVAYNAKKSTWDVVEGVMNRYMHPYSTYCVIEDILYSACYGVFRWYDTKLRMWRCLKGLVGLPKFSLDAHVRLADYGGKMTVFWKDDLPRPRSVYEKKICCAVIALERRNVCEIWGKVEWCDHVYTVPELYDLVKVLAVTI
ncbi:hypothetical protein EUTSA_v10026752mg [Eutrema salsugineum]|uniref:F-box domain-containing protein n=1 Tax=Eutrema salsugineum TaxID=72664 RepID=V4MHS5_EUTSA|nr:F-box/kelch-repeat protein At5g51250 [Eutrema salsugineum]ESQ56139.1 hypothetical protein EUTSA_v10026752mg [Eutrema salsugineum]